MDETDANSRQATAPGLELLNMITNQPSFDDSGKFNIFVIDGSKFYFFLT